MGINKKREVAVMPDCWKIYEPEDPEGYSWVPMYFMNYLTSDVILEMNLAEQGLFVKALMVQVRDRFLRVKVKDFAKQVQIRPSTAANFLSKFGSRIFTCVSHPYDTHVTRVLHGCNMDATWMLHGCSTDATPVLHGCYTGVTPVDHACSMCVNGTMHYVAVSGGVNPPFNSIEENTIEERRGEDISKSSNKSTSAALEFGDDEIA